VFQSVSGIAMIITPVHRWKDAIEKYLLTVIQGGSKKVSC